MDEEIIRRKYIRLKNNVINIRNKISRLSTYNNKVINSIEDTLLVDDKIFNESEIKSVYSNSKKIISEINNSIIPSINRKI
ncbi:MAG: hypothetical protein E7166_01100 [Firmicutes bacterium]|nr:hypothetical protein [Bacillota bacterium]